MPKKTEKTLWPIIATFYQDPSKEGCFFTGALNEKYKEYATSYDKLMKNVTEGSSFYLRKSQTSKGTDCFHLCLRPPLERAQHGGSRKQVEDDGDEIPF